MANPIGEAFVRVSPNLDRFRADLERELKKALKGLPAVQVPVTAAGTAAPAAAARGLTVPVTPVVAEPKPRTGRTAASTADVQAARAEQDAIKELATVEGLANRAADSLAVAQAGLTAKTGELAAAQDLLETAIKAQTEVEKAAQIVQRTGNDVLIKRIALLREEAAALTETRRSAVLGLEASRKQQTEAEKVDAQAASAGKRRAAAATAITEANSAFAAANTATAASLNDVKTAEANLGLLESAREKALRALTAAEATEDAGLKKRATGLVSLTSLEGSLAKARASQLAAAEAASAVSRTEQIENAKLAVSFEIVGDAALRLAKFQALEGVEAGNLTQIKARLAQANAIVADTEEAVDAALRAQRTSLVSYTQGLRAAAVAQRDLVKAELDQVVASEASQRAQAAEAATLSTVARGAGATGLSFAGLRGATLAASGSFLAGAAAASILVKSIGAFASFEQTLNTFQAVTGATAAQMERVSDAAKRLGSDITLPAVSAADAATAMAELAKAGLSVNQAIAATRGVLQLATAASLDNAEAVQLVATALNAFQLNGDQAVHVADGFANAANAAQGSVGDFGQALEQSAAVAHQAGVSFNDTIALLTLFARAGLRGSDAGTSLRTALIKLIAPTKSADEVIKALGLHIRDANGNIRPDIFAQFGEATAGLTPKLRDTFAEIIAGQDAIRAFSIGARAGADGLKQIQEETTKQGTVAAVSAARTRGLAGEAEAFKNSAATLAITVGRGLSPAIIDLTRTANNAVGSLSGVASAVGDISGAFAPLARVVGAATRAFGAGLGPILAVGAAFKAYRAIAAVIVAEQEAIAKSNIKLATTGAVLTAEEEAEAAAARQLAAAQAEVSATQAARSLGAAGLAGSISRLISPLGLAATGAIALGFALKALGDRENDTEKATDALNESLQRLERTRNAHNLADFREALTRVRDAIKAANEASKEQLVSPTFTNQQRQIAVLDGLIKQKQDQLVSERDSGAPQSRLQQIRDAISDLEKERTELQKENTQLRQRIVEAAKPEALDDFIKATNAAAQKAADAGDQLNEHNLLVLRDFTRAVGHLPTNREFQIIIKNEKLSAGLAALRDSLRKGGDQAQADAEVLGDKIAEKISIGIARGATTNPNLISPITKAAEDAQKVFALTLSLPKIPEQDRQEVVNNIKGLIAEIAALGPLGEAQLRILGSKLGKALAQGISAEKQESIRAANEAVAEAREAADQQVIDSINQAKSNLGSLTDSLVSQAEQVIDARVKKIFDAFSDPKATLAHLRSEIGETQKSFQQLFFVQNTGVDPLKVGNIDVLHRKVVDLGNGFGATVRSVGINLSDALEGADTKVQALFKNIKKPLDQVELLIPTIVNGKAVSIQKAADNFRKTGQNLGTFATVADANKYAQKLHEQQATFYKSGQTLGKATASGFDSVVTRAFNLSREINRLQEQLDHVNQAEQRASLRFAIGQATDDATRQSAVFKLREFDLQTKLDSDKKKLDSDKDLIQKTADAQKEAIKNNLSAYADAFAKGQITLAQFSGKILNTLKTQSGSFANVGGLLGSAFKRTFDAQIQGVLDQAAALAGFQGKTPGGTSQVSKTDVGKSVREANRKVEDALHARNKTLAQINAEGNDILNKILAAAQGSRSPKTRNTGRKNIVVGPTNPVTGKSIFSNPLSRAGNP